MTEEKQSKDAQSRYEILRAAPGYQVMRDGKRLGFVCLTFWGARRLVRKDQRKPYRSVVWRSE